MGGDLIGTAQEVTRLAKEVGDTRVGQAIAGVLVDCVGLLVGDWMSHVRVRHLADLSQRTHEILEARGVEPLPAEGMSPVLLRPIMEAAADEGRPELRELWAKLMAAAMDPRRVSAVRQSFLDAVKRMDPADAKVFDHFSTAELPRRGLRCSNVAPDLGMTDDEVRSSFDNLRNLDLAEFGNEYQVLTNPSAPAPESILLTAKGRELLRAIMD
jgi:hypothetical protein